jgi:hypothetical protein
MDQASSFVQAWLQEQRPNIPNFKYTIECTANMHLRTNQSPTPIDDMSLECNGALTSDLTGMPLQDIRVELYFLEPSDEIEQPHGTTHPHDKSKEKPADKHPSALMSARPPPPV